MGSSKASCDVIVLGAGMAGVSTALHLQQRGQKVVLIDRRQPGEETSHGNAGIIEQDGLVPLTIPHKLLPLLKYASNREIAMHYHPLAMPRLAGWLWRMWLLSTPRGIDSYARRVQPLRANASREHFHFADDAEIRHQFRETGWIHLYHGKKQFEMSAQSRAYGEEFGVAFDILDCEGLEALEPYVAFADDDYGIFWKGCVSVSSPMAVTKAYGDLFVRRGGTFAIADAQSLKKEGDVWHVTSPEGPIRADKVVVTLGPWSMDLLKPMGYHFPLAPKRGYHQHFLSRRDASLNRPIVDETIGFLLTPTEKGIRLTTGIEFADRDARPTPTQLYRATEWARHLYPLGAPVEDQPWMGSRPCLPDSLPIIEGSSRDPGLYFNFGHGHMGFAVGPATGRMMAEMIVGETPFINPAGFASGRF